MRAFSAVDLSTEIKAGATNPLRGWISPNYGHRMSAPALTFTTTSTFPLRVVTVLYPVADADAKPPAVKVHIDHGVVTGLTLSQDINDSGGEITSISISIDDHDVAVDE